MKKAFDLSNIINHLIRSESFTKFIAEIEKNAGIEKHQNSISIKQLNGSLRIFFIAALIHHSRRPCLIITQNNNIVSDWINDLALVMDSVKIAPLTDSKKKLMSNEQAKEQQLLHISDQLTKLLEQDHFAAVAAPQIFDMKLPGPELFIDSRITLAKGENCSYNDLILKLALQGFARKDFVSNTGDMAVRGGIVDFFPIGWDNPIRLEFWGDQIDSIREFHPLSQRSIRIFDKVEFVGGVVSSELNKNDSTIFDYLPDNTVVVFDSPDSFAEDAEQTEIPEKYIRLMLNKIGKTDINIKSSPQPGFNASIENLTHELRKMVAADYKILLCADGEIHKERLRELTEDKLSSINDSDDLDSTLADVKSTAELLNWAEKSPSEGFIFPEIKTALITEHQVFDRMRMQSRKPKSSDDHSGMTLRELKQLQIGDYVVHDDKGIGRFDGFQEVTLGGSRQDCVRLLFSGGDVLYVNLNYIHKIQKYSAQEGVVPTLSKLGSAEWARKKARTKKRLKDIARDLIKLYAKRKMQPGYAYPPDTIWQKEFEASFIYEDTPDQAKTTSEFKDDMESDTPMDRLVCGDVGFGKTEIAIRAAFKAAQEGRQVALLVPTTILAQQHYMTFRDRLAKYPVTVEVISRFKSKKQQTEIVQGVKDGKTDILIGTHRLLSKDIEFKNLGLLIIDEEHRFGVSAKEKLRKLQETVDTLTLTATPIPRTLNFSLMGVRDLSIIETPPRNRIPVITEIIEWNDEEIVRAINYEIERKGQVFFVTDRVHNIEELELKLKMLMPTIKFGIAHGQMKTSQLESVMEKFIQGKFDVLITTKIVESGLDIPNTNTIIINHANNFGLAELYQLRGRVGRANKQAYCFLIIPPAHTLSTNSIRRLQAIEEFTDLGSGFQLAMRDMEIRGAGDLLGAEQSGFINDIGFELFHKILDEAVEELRREEFSDLFAQKLPQKRNPFTNEDLVIEINRDAYIPGDYIKSDTERFYFYKKLYDCKKHGDLKSITEEMKDRFGSFSKEIDTLIFIVKLRISGIHTGFVKIVIFDNKMTADFPHESNTEYYQKAFPYIAEYIQEIPRAQLKQDRKSLKLIVELDNQEQAAEILWKIKHTVETMDE